MAGDYNRYISEISVGSNRDMVVKEALESYQAATEIAENLPTTHPIRLGLALNFSVFYYEIKNDCKKACKLAKDAFNGAMDNLDRLQQDSYKDSTLILQLLRDNLTVSVGIFLFLVVLALGNRSTRKCGSRNWR